MISLCSIVGHAGTWKNAHAEGEGWRSHCARCDAVLTRRMGATSWQRVEPAAGPISKVG